MTKQLLFVFLAACGSDPGGGGVDGGPPSDPTFAGNWVARPYRWNVTCTKPGSSTQFTQETDNLTFYRLELTGSTLKMHVDDGSLACVQLFSISGNRATRTGDEGACQWKLPDDSIGMRTTSSDELVLSGDGKSFDETAKYTDKLADGSMCTGNDSGTWYRR